MDNILSNVLAMSEELSKSFMARHPQSIPIINHHNYKKFMIFIYKCTQHNSKTKLIIINISSVHILNKKGNTGYYWLTLDACSAILLGVSVRRIHKEHFLSLRRIHKKNISPLFSYLCWKKLDITRSLTGLSRTLMLSL